MDKQDLRCKVDGVCNGSLKDYRVGSGRATPEYLKYRGIQANILEIKVMQHRCTRKVVGPRVIMEGDDEVALEAGCSRAGSTVVDADNEQRLQSSDRLCVSG